MISHISLQYLSNMWVPHTIPSTCGVSSQHHTLFCTSCIIRYIVDTLPNTSYYLKSIKQSIQVKSWNKCCFFKRHQITLLSENFMISDMTWNKLYIMPGIRISRLLFLFSSMVCMLMKVFHLCWEIWEKAKEMCGFKFAA